MSSDSEFDRLLLDDSPNLADKNCLKFGEGEGCKKERSHQKCYNDFQDVIV